ncbi:hypothetical protein AALB53_01770 [Lachnospiraceae bacterium 47-T17]
MAITGIGNYGSYGMSAGYGSYGTYGAANAGKSTAPDEQVKPGRKSSPGECDTCKQRKYQDGSNEGDVSFKTPGHISPQASAAAVRAHEQEHVGNAYEKAAKEGGKVRSATVSLRTEICPECGTSYVAGGETRTAISYPKETQAGENENPYQKNNRALDAIKLVGANVDLVA